MIFEKKKKKKTRKKRTASGSSSFSANVVSASLLNKQKRRGTIILLAEVLQQRVRLHVHKREKERLPVEKYTDERKFIHTFTFKIRAELHLACFHVAFLNGGVHSKCF